MAKKIRVKNPNEILAWLKKKCVPFFLEQTMFTKKIDSRFGKMEFVNKDTEIKPFELSFIGLVKKYCEANPKYISVDRKTINYIFDGKMKQSYHYKEKVFEIDLTGAYWNFAFNEGHISEEVYKRGLEVRKTIRLIALGNLAKRTLELRFDGEKYMPAYFRPSILTQDVFFHVSYLTDLLMRKLIVIANKDFLFYWVDAIFVQGERARDEVINYLESEQIKYKLIEIKDVIKTKNKIVTIDDEHINLDLNEHGQIKNEKGERTFNFKKSNFIDLIKKKEE